MEPALNDCGDFFDSLLLLDEKLYGSEDILAPSNIPPFEECLGTSFEECLGRSPR